MLLGIRHVEARARDDEHVLALQQLHREPPVVEPGDLLDVDARERVERPPRRHHLQERGPLHAAKERPPLPPEAPVLRGEIVDALHPPERRLHRPLPRDVGAEAQRGEQLETFEVVGRVLLLAAEEDPAGAHAAGAVHLGEPAEGRAERALAERRHGDVLGAVVEDAVVDLVREEHQAVPLGDAHQRLDRLARVDRAGGVVGVDEDQRARARGDQRLDLGGVGDEAVLGAAEVVDGARAGDRDGRRPQPGSRARGRAPRRRARGAPPASSGSAPRRRSP